MRFLILVPLLLCCSCAAAADTVRVVKVHDGDTVHCLRGDTVTVNVRLQAIDAPELGQPFGTVARDRLAGLSKGKTATIH